MRPSALCQRTQKHLACKSGGRNVERLAAPVPVSLHSIVVCERWDDCTQRPRLAIPASCALPPHARGLRNTSLADLGAEMWCALLRTCMLHYIALWCAKVGLTAPKGLDCQFRLCAPFRPMPEDSETSRFQVWGQKCGAPGCARAFFNTYVAECKR